MRFFASPWLLLSLFFILNQPCSAQNKQVINEYGKGFYDSDSLPMLTQQDSIRQSKIPELKLPEQYRNQVLPEWVDNSQQPYFRPILTQTGFECSQTTGVAYTFTYEIDRLRNLPANVIENQYPTHFVFNWCNQGTGSACSFFDSWDIIQLVGTPTVSEYGGTPDFGGNQRWMNGYDLYHSAMKNRLWEFYSISLKDEEGLLTLKHWINDHLDGSETGGVASIYCAYSTLNDQLPFGTPEAGKYVIPELENPANHAVCIVGYHDSIRWDYNNDGQFTNHLDINNDGVVDFRDWEIGGVKVANSYPMTNWGDFGFAYLTYNALCRTMAQNGIWNQAANVIFAKENTDPQLTYKITLTHDKRYNLRVLAGVSSQPNTTEPEYVLGFPILNYQGGPYYMQGGTLEEDKTLEFGLDVTALLGFIEPGAEATFLLMVDEDDPGNSSTGQINNWSVMDYTGELTEIPYYQTNVPLVENGLTLLGIGATIDFTPPEVADASLPPATVNEPYENQMTGAQGAEPYRWWLHQNYHYEYSNEEFPAISAEELFPNNTGAGYASKVIEFDFPFYGKTYNTFYIHTDGYLMFEENELPWIFVTEDLNVFKNLCNISPYMARVLGTEGGGMWYEGDASKATFRWKAIENGTGNILNFAVSLYPSGNIEFFYGTTAFAAWNRWYSGISNGDGYNFELLDISNTFNLEQNLKATIEPEYDFTEMALIRDGVFHGTPHVSYEEANVSFYIQDANGLRSVKTLPFSTEGANNIVISRVWAETGNDTIIEYGESVGVTVELKNMTNQVVVADTMKISVWDEFVSITDSILPLTFFEPGETKIFTNAFGFVVAASIPDDHTLIFNTQIIAQTAIFNSHIYLEAFSPVLSVAKYTLDDGGNNYAEPGEELNLAVQIKNTGGAKAYNVAGKLLNSDPWVTIITGEAEVGTIAGNHTADAVFTIFIDHLVPPGYSALFNVEISDESGFSANKTIVVKVGNILEDAETGDFSHLDWQFSGASPWQIDQENPYEGRYCMKSGTVEHSRFSELSLTLDVLADDEIRFYNKVSSQEGFDFLRFSIDKIVTGLWSGEKGWTERVFPVKAGERTFTWTYVKDHTIEVGSDCAWLDSIVFPPSVEQKLALTAGTDMIVCENQVAFTRALAVFADSFSWSTAGDGTFSSTSSLTPVYTPGEQDISIGSAQLALNAWNYSGDTLSENLSVILQNLPVVSAGNDTIFCFGEEDFVMLSGNALNTSMLLWLTLGDGSFDNPETLKTLYYPGPGDLAEGSVNLTLVGFPVSPCETGTNHSIIISLFPMPPVAFDSLGNFCNNAPSYKLIQGSPEGGIYSGPAVIDGWFYPAAAGVGTHVLTYSYTDDAGCTNTANRQAVVINCTGIENHSANRLTVSPNPGNGIFMIHGGSLNENTYLLTVQNATAKQILGKPVERIAEKPVYIDLSDQPPGIYLVRLTGRNEVVTGKIVVGR